MNFHLEALKLLKDWSIALVAIEIGALSVLGAITQNTTASQNPWIIMTILCFTTSIIISANVIGAIPNIVQSLDENIARYKDIYRMPNKLGIPIIILVTTQHVLFLVGFIGFVVFMFVYSDHQATNL